MSDNKKKILLIGWDAADWKVINPLMDHGLMPILNKLVNEGSISNLATLDPPLSPMLWTSIATGKRPYKHGIIGFTEVADDGKKIKPITIRNRKCKALWNILSDQGYKTHVVGWWPSHPAEKINGISVSNFFQKAFRPINEPWPMKPGTIYPEDKSELFAQMRIHPSELTENHIGVFIPEFAKIDQQKDKSLEVLAKVIAENATIHAAATYIMEFEEWDFMAVYYDGIDHFNHGFMKYHPPKNDYVNKQDFEIYKDVVTAGYRYHDLMLARLLQLAGDDCSVILVSDHGFHHDHLRKQFIPAELAGPATEHSQYGIFCIKGEGIKKDEIIYGSSILDVTPTLLTLLNLPVGEDMDGKALTSVFEEEIKPQVIPTWESDQQTEQTFYQDTINDEETLQQLADLGYIEKPATTSKEEGIALTIRENDFYLARAYVDGNRYADAVYLLENLFKQKPAQARFASSLCDCYQKLLQYDKVAEVLTKFENALKEKHEEQSKADTEKNIAIKAFEIPPGLRLMKATSLMSQGHAQQALDILNDLLSKHNASGKLNLKAAICYGMLGKWKKAIEYFNKELDYNYDEPEAHHGIGYSLLKQEKYADAIEHFLNAIDLRFNYSVAHYHLGEAFYRTQQYEQALQAYEVSLKMEPGLNRARMRISEILEKHFQQEQSATVVKNTIKENLRGIIYVVSGLPRSGTSLMMQMLVAGGMNAFTDNKRISDVNNPRGYFEHEAVLSLRRDVSWLEHAKYKVVKVVSPLLTFLPPRYNYKIILMERDIVEIMTSQQLMLQKQGKTDRKNFSLSVMETYKSNLEQVKQWTERNKLFVELLTVDYASLINEPLLQIKKINEFLNLNLNINNMIDAIDISLYRNKNSETVIEN